MGRRKKDARRRERTDEIRNYQGEPADRKEKERFWHIGLLRAVKPVDWIIMTVSVIYFIAIFDFQAIEMRDVFYLTAIIMWGGSFLVRLYLLSKRGNF